MTDRLLMIISDDATRRFRATARPFFAQREARYRILKALRVELKNGRRSKLHGRDAAGPRPPARFNGPSLFLAYRMARCRRYVVAVGRDA